MKTWVLGDVHGQYNALKQVLSRSGFKHDTDKLIFLGDVVDRGKQPFECIAELLRIRHKVLIRGNHDANFGHYIDTGIDDFEGQNGAAYTIKKWLETNEATKAAVRQFFSLQVNYFVDEVKRCFIHGGFFPNLLLQEHSPNEFYWNRVLWYEALKRHPKPIECKEDFTEIFIGHTPTIKTGSLEPMFRAGIWNLDTGAGFDGGKLTLMNLETKEYVQSDPVKTSDQSR